MPEIKFPPEIIWTLIAIFGGVARYLDTFLRGSEIFNIMRFVATIFVTGFTGYMCALVFMQFQPGWVLIAAGVGGYAGTQILDLLVEFLKFKIGVKNLEEEVKKDKKD